MFHENARTCPESQSMPGLGEDLSFVLPVLNLVCSTLQSLIHQQNNQMSTL